jgi:hypothetical protein
MSGVAGRSGRKPEDINLKMIAKLSPLDDKAFQMLKEGIEAGDFQFLKLWFGYRFGLPKQQTELTLNSEQPLFNLN